MPGAHPLRARLVVTTSQAIRMSGGSAGDDASPTADRLPPSDACRIDEAIATAS